MAWYGLFSILDYSIYWLSKLVMRLIILIANANFFKNGVIEDISSRVYVILGVLVLFKIVISCVQYMVNPDSFDDKDKGMGGILKKAVICMGLLVLVQPMFNFALTMQKSIVSTIPSIVMGSNSKYDFTDSNVGNLSNQLNEIGDNIAYTTLRAFVDIRQNDATHTRGKDNMSTFEKGKGLESFRDNIMQGCDNGAAVLKYFTTDQCDYNYMFIISTAAGIFLLYILLSMSIDIGIRSIKLGLLQILAPIPISSYIVSKDKLNKFFKLSVKVYLDLFVRLIVIFFIIFFVDKVMESLVSDINMIDGYKPEGIEAGFVKIIIIIALFMFAKNAPKFITDALGIDGGGFGDMKDMFTRGGGLLGTTAAGFRTARSNYVAQKERAFGKGLDRKSQIAAGLRSAAAGFASSTGRGLMMTGQGKGFKDVRQNAFKNAITARNRRSDRVDNLYNREKYIDAVDENGNYILDANGNRQQIKNPEYYGYRDYRRDVKREKLGIPSDTAFIKARYDAMEKIAKMAADSKSHGVGKMNETPNRYQISLRDASGSYISADAEMISNALGVNNLSMEQVRNFYTMARNGQALKTVIKMDKDGKPIRNKDTGELETEKVQLEQSEVDALGTLVQTIEKRTSYMKEAELMATGDPVASPNVDKLVIGLKTNRSMFTSPEIMAPIILKMDKDLKNYRVNPNDVNDHRVKIDGKEFDPSNYNGLLDIVQHLQIKISEPKRSDDKYKNDPNADATFAADRKEYFETIAARADILTGIKDSFEEVTKTQYKAAQIADNKAQKAQQAVSNNDKKS